MGQITADESTHNGCRLWNSPAGLLLRIDGSGQFNVLNGLFVPLQLTGIPAHRDLLTSSLPAKGAVRTILPPSQQQPRQPLIFHRELHVLKCVLGKCVNHS